jgi:RNA polymerase sigma-70 factor (ECF subfamily)
MVDEAGFRDLIGRVRAGDNEAAVELVRRFEPVVRRAVRFRLVDARLSAALDSMDICQSVLASFFVRTAAGQFEIDSSEQLVKLLVSMARNKLASQARREQAGRRDRRRIELTGSMADGVAAGSPTPSQQVANRELLAEVYRRLSPDELELAQLRNKGHDWAAIATLLGVDSTLLRKRLSRALDRVSRELGLDQEHV